MTFGKILKMIREEKQLNQESLAKVFNVDRSTLGKWESDSSRPDYFKLSKIADYFNVSTDYLLGRTNTTNELDAVKVVKEAFDKGYSTDDIKDMIEFMEKINKKNDK